jgi:glycosyltransferase involved in cell wall biosynthesis
MPETSAPPRLSLCMIVRNEEQHLARCLKSVQGLADEIVLVDTGSTDGTVAIARQFGAQVVETTWENNFSTARNLGLARARGRWILVLDADEWLPPESCEAVRKLIHREPAEGFHLVTTSDDANGHRIRGEILRLFPNRADVRFDFPIHEEVNSSLARAGIPLRKTTIEIVHTGYADAAKMPEKAHRNRQIIERALSKPLPREMELHLRFYRAVALNKEGRYADAAREYEHCIAESGTLFWLADMARMRAAECYFSLGDLDRASAALPTKPPHDRHPAALSLRAHISIKRGSADEATQWFERVLECPDIVYLPPVPLAALKLKALTFLGNYWGNRGRKDAGVKTLRLALEIQQKKRDGASVAVAEIYREIVRG